MEFSPRNLFFDSIDDSFSLTGSGAKVVIFDDGYINQDFFGKRFQNITKQNTHSDHAARVTSICAYGNNALNSNDLIGVAPKVTVFNADYLEVFPTQFYNIIKEIQKSYGRIHISAHAYSAVENSLLRRIGYYYFSKLFDSSDIEHLAIAAAGHIGNKGIRFPASLEKTLSVGVCDNNFIPTKYCSVDLRKRKPEVLVSDVFFLGKISEDVVGKINGTSAAVGIVAGLAALWCEFLLEKKIYPNQYLLKALILSSTFPSVIKPYRVIQPSREFLTFSNTPVPPFYKDSIFSDAVSIQKVSLSKNTPLLFNIERGKNRNISIVFVQLQSFCIIRAPQNLVSLSIHSKHKSQKQEEGKSWVVIDWDYEKELSLTLKVESEKCEGYLVVNGVSDESVTLNSSVLNLDRKKSMSKKIGANISKKKDLVILGISASHDASACIIKNGSLLRAVHLERLSRIKRDGFGFLHSEDAIRYCLESLDIKENEVDFFAFNNQPLLPQYVGLSQPINDKDFKIFNPFGDRSLYVTHHLAHAFSSYYSSPFDTKTAVFVCDGSGGSTIGKDDLIMTGSEFQKYVELPLEHRPQLHVESTYIFDHEGFQLLDRVYAESFNVRCGSASLGETYAAVSQYIFGNWQDGGKLMGLAPYGNPDSYGPSLLKMDSDGLLKFTSDWKLKHNSVIKRVSVMENKDLAARIQKDLETALLQRFKKIFEKTNVKQVCYSGGVALNCVANDKIIRESGFTNFYAFPASNDAGISVGAAAAAFFKITGKTKGDPVSNMYLGHPYIKEDYQEAIDNFSDYITSTLVTEKQVAENLSQGKIYGLFEGAAEFGPRALGHRSIIADPRSESTWSFINKKIKFREDFRPFAPAIPQEDLSEFFDINEPSLYMMRTANVLQKHKINLGAITHVNGTARIQTVNESILPRFYRILKEFGNITKYPILINTSLNVRGQPIVETPMQAIELLLSTHLDGLLFENILVKPSLSSDEELEDKDIIILAPDAVLFSTQNSYKTVFNLKLNFREKESIPLKTWQFKILSAINGERSVEDIVKIVSEMAEKIEITTWIKSLFKLRIIYKKNKM